VKQTGLRWACVGAAALIIVLDQLSKSWALGLLKVEGASRPLAVWLDATLVFNRSNAFGVAPVAGEVSRWGLVALNLGVAAALAWWLWRRRLRTTSALAAAFLIGGAVGNAIDRIRWSVVIDFLDLSRLGFRWVFNLADVSVDVGIALLALSIATAREPKPTPDVARDIGQSP
jgi:signal peptidase II